MSSSRQSTNKRLGTIDKEEERQLQMKNSKTKVFLVKGTSLAIFGDDYENRIGMSPEEAVQRFDEIWPAKLEPLIQRGHACDFQLVQAIVIGRGKEYINGKARHVYFNLNDACCIAQISGARNCDAIWPVTMIARETTTLKVKFASGDIKHHLQKAAKVCNSTPTKVAEKLIVDFLETVLGKRVRRLHEMDDS